MRTRLFPILFICSMLISCGSSDDDTPSDESTGSTTQPLSSEKIEPEQPSPVAPASETQPPEKSEPITPEVQPTPAPPKAKIPSAIQVLQTSMNGNTAKPGNELVIGFALTGAPDEPIEVSAHLDALVPATFKKQTMVFNAENWYQVQYIKIVGEALSHPSFGDYDMTFSVLSDTNMYSDMTIQPIKVKPYYLQLPAPKFLPVILPYAPVHAVLSSAYSHNLTLSYALVDGPMDMSVEAQTGSILWTPTPGDKGKIHTATFSVTDGTLTDTVSIELAVSDITALNVDRQAGDIVVNQPEHVLHNSKVTVGNYKTRENTLYSHTNIDVYATDFVVSLPEKYQRVGSAFQVGQRAMILNEGEPDAQLTMPYIEGLTSDELVQLTLLVWSPNAEGNYSWQPLAFTTDHQAKQIIVPLYRLGFVLQWVRDTDSVLQTSSTSQLFKTLATNNEENSVCKAIEVTKWGLHSHINHVCKEEGSGVTLTIEDFGSTKYSEFMLPEDIYNKFIEVSRRISVLNMDFDNTFSIVFFDEPFAPRCDYIYFNCTEELYQKKGEVYSVEDYKILHLNSRLVGSEESIQTQFFSTMAHEYFHHANARTSPDMMANINRHWATEGLARWFEDHFNDDANLYLSDSNTKHLPYTLFYGLTTAISGGQGTKNPYNRFAFWKLLTNHCEQSTLLTNIFEMNWYKTDILAELSNALRYSKCDFKSSERLAQALLHYQYALAIQEDMSVIESDENIPSDFYITRDTFNGQITITPSAIKAGQTDIKTVSLKPGAAITFKIEAADLLENEGITINTTSKAQPISVSYLSLDPQYTHADSQAIGSHEHAWYYHVIDQDYDVTVSEKSTPDIFITVINDHTSLNRQFDVKITKISEDKTLELPVGEVMNFTGTGTNLTFNVGFTLTMDILIDEKGNITGAFDADGSESRVICGAGEYTGSINDDVIKFSFVSGDTDAGCGFENGWVFDFEGTFTTDGIDFMLDGDYSINGQTGVFGAKTALSMDVQQ